MRLVTACVLLGLAAAPASLAAQDRARPEQFQALLRCRAETDDAARLRCFDHAAATLEQAAETGAIVVNTRADVREARRSLFGFVIPRFLRGSDEEEEEAEEFRELRTTVRAARESGFQRLTIDLTEGGRWQTIDTVSDAPPRPGDAVLIRRNAIGYMMLIRGIRPTRVRRIE